MHSKPSFDKDTKIWTGPKCPPKHEPNQSIGNLILTTLKKTPDLITQISEDSGVALTCSEMYKRSIKIAKYFQKFGFTAGETIGIVAVNSENLPPVIFACFTLGLPINPLSPIMNEADMVQMFSNTKPKVIFCDADNLKVVQNAVHEMESDAKIMTVMEKVNDYDCVAEVLKEMDREDVDDFEFPAVDPMSTAAILISSGSTGFPKGICKSHKQILTNLCPIWSYSDQEQTVFLQSSSIFWLSGFYGLVISAIYGCTRITTANPITPNLLTEITLKFNVTVLMLPPYLALSLISLENLVPFEKVKHVLLGGAIVTENLVAKAIPYFPNGQIYSVYGCTEQDFVSVNCVTENLKTSGYLLDNVEVMITDDDLNPLDPNQQGEICVKIPVQFNGYFNEPQKTAEAMFGNWYKTGDIGYFDSNGFFYIVDRKKQLLKYKNFQITPSEIEAILDGIEGVTSSCVIGVLEADTGNDIVHAFVTVNKQSSLTEGFILEYVNSRVIDPKKIRGGVKIVEALPVGMTGKVDKKKVKEIALALL